MGHDTPDESPHINADMTILDVVSRYPQTETVFKHYDDKVGVCLCCQALFDPLKDVAENYGLHLGQLLADLELAATGGEDPVDSSDQERKIAKFHVKNPVLPYGASSKEKAILAIHPLPSGWAPALPGGAFWLFHVNRL